MGSLKHHLTVCQLSDPALRYGVQTVERARQLPVDRAHCVGVVAEVDGKQGAVVNLAGQGLGVGIQHLPAGTLCRQGNEPTPGTAGLDAHG